jgi:hypothetical protein
MPACPWCKAATSDPLAPCPRCGRTGGRTADDPARASLASAGARGGNDVPDLDLPPRVSKGAIPNTAPSPPPAATEWAERGATDRIEGMEATGEGRTFEGAGDFEGGSLELDLSSGPPLILGAPSGAPKPAAALGSKPSLGAIATAPSSGGPAGTEVTPTVEEAIVPRVLLDPYEARAVADYGEVPNVWWKTPLYAFRVLRRRPELKELSEQKTLDAERAKRAAEEALLSFAEVVRYDAEKLGAYEEALQAVRVAEQVLGKRDAVLASETDAHKHRQAESNAKLAELEAQLSHVQIEERQVADELAEAGALLKRAEAHVKRIEAEMRTALAQEQGTALGAVRGSGP